MRTPFFRPRPKRPVKMPILFRGNTEDETALMTVPHAYFDNIVNGKGDVEMYLTLVYRVFVGLALTKFITENQKAERVVKAALGSLWFTGERILKKHKVGFSGNEMQNIKAALVLIDDLQAITTRKEQRDSYADVGFKVGGMTLTLQSLEPFKGYQ